MVKRIIQLVENHSLNQILKKLLTTSFVKKGMLQIQKPVFRLHTTELTENQGQFNN